MTLFIPDLIAACETAEEFGLSDYVTGSVTNMFGPSNEPEEQPEDKPQEEPEIKVEVKAEVGGGNGK